MNVIDAISELRHDLDRAIQSLEALRNGFGLYASVAPFLDQPRATVTVPANDPRLKDFFDQHCLLGEAHFVTVSALWKAYLRWCRLNGAVPLGHVAFNFRMTATGARYSRSRRIRGRQTRTWEGIGLRTKHKPVN